jgi:GNAT superfamily N-acetyltransferase
VSSFRAVDYEPSRRDAVLELLRTVWGRGPEPDEWAWWFEGNPTGPRLFTLAEADGRVVGTTGMSFLAVRLGGRRVELPFLLHAAVHPDYRSRGVWAAIERRNEDAAAAAGAPVALGFTTAAATRVLVGKLGWRELARFRVWAAPRFAGRPRGVRELERFDAETDALYEHVAQSWPAHVCRRAEHMNWRYADSPRPYRIFATGRGRSVSAYAVLGRWRRFAVVADLVAPPGAFAGTRALLAACARHGAGAALLALPPRDSALRAAFVSRLFAPTHKTFPLVGRRLLAEAHLAEGRDAWHVALGDTDFV